VEGDRWFNYARKKTKPAPRGRLRGVGRDFRAALLACTDGGRYLPREARIDRASRGRTLNWPNDRRFTERNALDVRESWVFSVCLPYLRRYSVASNFQWYHQVSPLFIILF
jgi:hypothetical protein